MRDEINLLDFIGIKQVYTLQDLKDRNTAYKDLKEQEQNFMELTDEVLDELPHDDREIILRYHLIMDTLHDQEKAHLYYTGYRDCVTLLKQLGVL